MIRINVTCASSCTNPRMFKKPIARDVAVIFIVKMTALALLYALFFSPSHQARVETRALFEIAAWPVTR